MNEIVKYHNDFNKLNICDFSELEQNIIMGILVKARFYNLERFEMNAFEIAEFMPSRNPSQKDVFDKVLSLKKNLFKLEQQIEIDHGGGLKELSFYNLFSSFTIYFDNYITNEKIFKKLSIKLNDDFYYLLQNLVSNFTQFELEEFLFLSGKYARVLYIHLKQFRTSGIWRVKWDEFKELLGIPNSYKMCDIDKQILKPVVAQLSDELNLFERSRIPFRNLKYKKIKGKGRGRGGAVTHIEFTFDRQTVKGENYINFDGRELAPSNKKEFKKTILKPHEVEILEKKSQLKNREHRILFLPFDISVAKKDTKLYIHQVIFNSNDDISLGLGFDIFRLDFFYKCDLEKIIKIIDYNDTHILLSIEKKIIKESDINMPSDLDDSELDRYLAEFEDC